MEKEKLQPANYEKNKSLFVKSFWMTIIVLFIITLLMLALSVINTPSNSLQDAANQRAYEALSDELIAAMPTFVGEVMTKVADDPFPKTEQKINESVDKAFSLAYQNIPKFADAHYSVVGEYVELGLGATGQLSSYIQKQLFSNLDSSLSEASTEVSKTFNIEIFEKVDFYSKEVTQNIPITSAQKLSLEKRLSSEIQTHISMLRDTGVIGAGAIGAMSGVATVKLIAANISRKLLIKLGAKYSAKLAAKSASTGSLAAAGAAIGSFIPGIGTAIGGIVGGIAGWVIADVAFVSVDEWINRDEFEQDLYNLITEQKNIIKTNLKHEVNKIKAMLASDEKGSVVGETPSSLN